MDHSSTGEAIHAELLSFIATMSSYAQTMNVDGLMSLYHPDATAFQFGATDGVMRLSDIRRNCEQGYRAVRGKFEYQFTPAHVGTGPERAYVCGVETIAGISEAGPFAFAVQATYCLSKVGERWLIEHQHLSMAGQNN